MEIELKRCFNHLYLLGIMKCFVISDVAKVLKIQSFIKPSKLQKTFKSNKYYRKLLKHSFIELVQCGKSILLDDVPT